ncbi:MAG: HDOD domain-containing protein [Planctomycetales bacterium]|nr:HDOD domain-containing protein [Planctomycetales bacterium]
MLPTIAMEAIEIAKDPGCSIIEFTSVVERDLKLASDLLRMANSVLHSPTAPIVRLNQAVVRLGFRQCQNLIIASSIASLINRVTLNEEWIRALLWRHGFLTATISLHLNRTLNIGFQGEEFTAGLIHDIGRTLLAVVDPKWFVVSDHLDFREEGDFLCREQDVFGTDHAILGGWFAAYSGLPQPLVEVIRFHHAPAESDDAHQLLVALTAVADHMANHIQRDERPCDYDFESNAAIDVLASDSCHVRTQFSNVAVTVIEEAVQDVGEMMQLACHA